jgi:hypothetical protein
MRQKVKNKLIKLPAILKIDDKKSINGTLSLHDGLFTAQNATDLVFATDGNIEFEYDNKSYSFAFKNLGGKYFVSNYKNDPQYQKILTLINLVETLATKDTKPSIARKKI